MSPKSLLLKCLLVSVLAALASHGLAADIAAFEASGVITWTNAANSNAWYHLEWTAAIDSDDWRRSGQSLGPVQAQTNTAYSVAVPMAFRVKQDSVPPPSGMVLVDGGPFMMGDHAGTGAVSESPVHVVDISPFYIDRYEVSVEQMRQVMQWAYGEGRVTVTGNMVRSVSVAPADLFELGNDSFHPLDFVTGTFVVVNYLAYDEEGHYPVGNVTWKGALAYCHFRSLMEGIESGINIKSFACDFDAPGYRIPTEAEWEKAARGGLAANFYPWPGWGGAYGSHIDAGKANYDAAWFVRRGYYDGAQSPDTGPDMANGYGLYDMAGNIAEWCYDWYSSSWYGDSAATNRNTTGPSGPLTFRVIRGGYYGSSAFDVRCSARGFSTLSGSHAVGFRCVRRP